jgi:predicted enzyme related to lactoylglutathione lyase
VPPTGSGTNAFVCSIQVENFDKIVELILQNGGQVTLPKFAISGRCWQGYFADPDNNTFGIFEVDENINNLETIINLVSAIGVGTPKMR